MNKHSYIAFSVVTDAVMPEVFFITENNDMPHEDQYGHMVNVAGKVAIDHKSRFYEIIF